MFHKVKNISALPDFRLSVQFSEGITKIYDVKPLFEKLPVFDYFKNNIAEFYQVSVDMGGYGIVWNDDLDLSCDELWEHGTQVETPFDGLMSFADATQLWGLNESTLRKAITYGKLINGVDVCKFGKQWVVSIQAMKREYGDARWSVKNDYVRIRRMVVDQSFMVPVEDIINNDYDLSINKYKEVEYVAVEYPPTEQILDEIDAIEKEIAVNMAELWKLLSK